MASILLKTSEVFISLPNSAVHTVRLCVCAFGGDSSDTGLDWKALGKGWVTGTHFHRVVLILHKSCVKGVRSVRIPGWMSESRARGAWRGRMGYYESQEIRQPVLSLSPRVCNLGRPLNSASFCLTKK